MTVRSEETLRHMWERSYTLATRSNQLATEAADATADAEAAERTAEAHRTTAQKTRAVAEAMMAEALDLVDIVNDRRAERGLPPLKPGDPYEPPPVPVAGPGVYPAPTAPMQPAEDQAPEATA